MLGYGHIPVGARVLNQDHLALVGTSQQGLHPPLKSLHSGPGILSDCICDPIQFFK